MKKLVFIFLLSSSLFGCTPAQPTDASQTVTVYATSAAQPWLDELYACADSASVILNVSPGAPEITLRLGEPGELSTPAFQVGTEELLVVTNRQSPLGNLTVEQARVLFAGAGNASAQVWVYASGEDSQKLLDQLVMDGRRVTSGARLAVSPSQMIEAVTSDANAVGILPRRWMTLELREVLVIPGIPVLAVTPSEPQGVVRDLIACLQK
jgi:hypothetical protein